MKIGIDARLIGETGVGRYIRNLISQLALVDDTNSYIIFLKKDAFESFILPNSRFQKRLADVPWHSVAEQLVMPWIFFKEHLDLVHIPYFNVPIFYPGKFIVTIHDLTILHFDTGKATTLPYILYKLRRLGYAVALTTAIRRATKIIAVSKATKQEIMDHFHVSPQKITVTYEGVDASLSKNTKAKRLIKEKYFLYVGNAYPHKNIETLVQAFSHVPGDSKLIFVGKDDFFYRRLRENPVVIQLGNRIQFRSVVSDSVLRGLYMDAEALIFPSLMEGFGLPAIEALSLGCPVICSDISCWVRPLIILILITLSSLPSCSAKLLIFLDQRDLCKRQYRLQSVILGNTWLNKHLKFITSLYMNNQFRVSNKVYDASIESLEIRGKEEIRPWNLFEVIKTYLTPESRLLDVGCGTANKLIPLSSFVKDIVGLDIWKNVQMRKKAATNVRESGNKNITLIQGDSQKLPFPDNNFDILTYMLAPQYAQEAYRVLKPGGFIIIERVGEDDKKNFKEMFGNNSEGHPRGLNSEFKTGELAAIYKQDLMNTGFSDITVRSGKWNTWYTHAGLIKLFQAAPDVQDFQTQKDASIVDKIARKYNTSKGILTQQHRYLIIAQKK